MLFLLQAYFLTILVFYAPFNTVQSTNCPLTTFRTENLKINPPPRRSSSIIDEAIWLMRTHFLNRNVLSHSQWENLSKEYAGYSNVDEAMADLMGRFNDPYSRHIPRSAMMVRQRGIRGETVGVGMVIRRTWHSSGIVAAIKNLFLAPKTDFINTQNAEASDTSLPKVQCQYPNTDRSTVTSTPNGFSKILESLQKIRTNIGKRNVNQFILENSCLSNCYSYLSHLKVTCVTVTPFLIAATCQQLLNPNTKNKLRLNTWALKILSFSIGVIHVTKTISPFILPLEVISVQPGGPSESSGIEIGDHLLFIDGIQVSTSSMKKVDQLLCEGEVGDVVAVGIFRKNGNDSKKNSRRNKNSGDDKDSTSSSSRSGNKEIGSGNNVKHPKDQFCNKYNDYFTMNVIKESVISSRVSSAVLPTSHTSKVMPSVITKRNLPSPSTPFHNGVASASNIVCKGNRDEDAGGDSIGYICIKEFTQRTLQEVSNAIEDIKTEEKSTIKSHAVSQNDRIDRKHSLNALIIDLRGNLGGTLPSALDAASLFLPKGKKLLQMKRLASSKVNQEAIQNSNMPQGSSTLSTQKNFGGNFVKKYLKRKFEHFMVKRDGTEAYYSIYKDADITTPILLLVDAQTASASEIFAAALIDNERATCMGSTTVGKNVAQAIMMLSDGSGLVFTVREFLSPLGRYMGNGIIPHIVLPEYRKLDLSKLYWNSKSRKWEILENSFADNFRHIFQ